MRRALLVAAPVLAALLCAPCALAAGTASQVTLVAEPLSTAPPLYLGSALVPVGGSVRLAAVADLRSANGAQLDPSTLTYSWNVDGVTSLSGSGVGQRTLIVESPLEYRSSTVAVSVSSADGSISASDSIDLTASEPTMRLYERDPLLGVRFEDALSGTWPLDGSESTLYAAPFSYPSALGAPTVSWFVNGSLAQRGALITLRPTGSGAGTASISVTGASAGSVDAPASSASLTVSFGSGSNPSLFGL